MADARRASGEDGGGDQGGAPQTPPDAGRRNFLRAAGLGAAGVASAAAAALGIGRLQASTPPAPTAPVPFPSVSTSSSTPVRAAGPGFDHLVVLMFENRSFDNLFGYLYPNGAPNGQRFDGLSAEDGNSTSGGRTVRAHRYRGSTDAIMSSPRPDPGEEYPHVNTQLFGRVDPESNRHKKVADMTAPFNAPADGEKPSMSGFLQDYIDTFVADHEGRQPEADEYDVVMGSFDPAMLPVFSTLAREFAVFDAWHCAVPSQTFCNRSFFHASTSHGYVTNSGDGGYSKWFDPKNDAPTIFNRLDDAGIEWAVYYDERQIVSMTGFIHAPVLERFFRTNFRTMSRFHEDARNGTLPAYSFVEPRMIYDHNDMHPPVGPMTETDVDGRVVTGGAISDVRAGEALLAAVYDSIRTGVSPTGSNAGNTMLLVTFDEHGGTYDHVPPPSAVPPKLPGRTEMGFAFDRLGVRVPALAISAYTAAGTVVNDAFHHGSVISTLTTKYQLAPLTARDASAPTLQPAVNLSAPRDPASWPVPQPAYVPRNPEADAPFLDGDGDRPLSPPGVGLVGMLIARYGTAGDVVPTTYREAYELLRTRGLGLFGAG